MQRRQFLFNSAKCLGLLSLWNFLGLSRFFFSTSALASSPLLTVVSQNNEDITAVSPTKADPSLFKIWVELRPVFGSSCISVQISPTALAKLGNVVSFRLAILTSTGNFLASQQGFPGQNSFYIFDRLPLAFDGGDHLGHQLWFSVILNTGNTLHLVHSIPETLVGSFLSLSSFSSNEQNQMLHKGGYSSPVEGMRWDFLAPVIKQVSQTSNPQTLGTSPTLADFSAPFRAYFPWVEIISRTDSAQKVAVKDLYCFFPQGIPNSIRHIIVTNPVGQIINATALDPSKALTVQGVELNSAGKVQKSQKTCQSLAIFGLKQTDLETLPWVMIFFNHNSFMLKINVSLHSFR